LNYLKREEEEEEGGEVKNEFSLVKLSSSIQRYDSS
jgi:hypothetical protein